MFSNTGCMVILQRTVSFKLRLVHVAYVCIIYEKTKGQVPLGPLLGKQSIKAQEVYSQRTLSPYAWRLERWVTAHMQVLGSEAKDGTRWSERSPLASQPHIPLTKSSNVTTKMTRQTLILKGRLEPPRMMHSRKLLSKYSTKGPTHWWNSQLVKSHQGVLTHQLCLVYEEMRNAVTLQKISWAVHHAVSCISRIKQGLALNTL